jgi:GT2 family glycosyltransferase
MREVISMVEQPVLIMTAWNNLQLTKYALQTLFKNTTIPYDLFLINNGSSDGTKEYFNSLKSKGNCKSVMVMHNATNEGNVIPVNRVMQESSPQDVVLLNNDMEFPKGWLKALGEQAYKYDDNGIVGVRLVLQPFQLMVQQEAQNHFSIDEIKRVLTFRQTLNLGASWIKREVIDKVGLFDEGFGLGFVEDDDYCLRTVIAGFRLDSVPIFIKHLGSATFGADPMFFQQQFIKNKKYFAEKWGVKGIVFANVNFNVIIRHEIDELKIRSDVIEKKLDKVMEKMGLDSRLEITY